MNTNRNLVVLFVIVLASLLLSACQGIGSAASAAFNGNEPASVQALQFSPRIERCDYSSKQLMINDIRAQVDPNTGTIPGLSVNQWLDARMSSNTCIAAQ